MKKLMIAALAGVGLLLGFPQRTAHAASFEPVLTLGTSLTQAQKQGTIDTLQQAANVNNASQLTVTGDTLVKYLNPAGNSFTANSGVWSSALVQRTDNGGINVKLVPYQGSQNITTITADQYRNAALTAGVTNANLYITSAVKIDGSGALAGVYAAFAQNGQQLNPEQIKAAQDEVNTLSDITQQNKDKEGYTDKQLNNAVAGMKQQMASQSNQGEQTLSQNQIGNIVDSQLKNNNLGTIINNNQRTQIINLLVKIQNSGALNRADFEAQAKKLGQSIQEGATKLFSGMKDSLAKLDTEENRNMLQKVWTSIKNFFNNLWQWAQQQFG